jgi:hypothetical protein
MSFSREENHMRQVFNTLLPAQMREKVKKVMRRSGPRMLLHHPLLAIHHVIDGHKKPEKMPKNSLTRYTGVHLEIFPQNIKNKYCK